MILRHIEVDDEIRSWTVLALVLSRSRKIMIVEICNRVSGANCALQDTQSWEIV